MVALRQHCPREVSNFLKAKLEITATLGRASESTSQFSSEVIVVLPQRTEDAARWPAVGTWSQSGGGGRRQQSTVHGVPLRRRNHINPQCQPRLHPGHHTQP